MSKLQRIADLCACEVSVEINPHRNYYTDVQTYLNNNEYDDDDVSDDIRAEMIRRGMVVNVRAYSRTPVGFYLVLHYDLDAAFDEMLDILEGK